jgi:membrane protein
MVKLLIDRSCAGESQGKAIKVSRKGSGILAANHYTRRPRVTKRVRIPHLIAQLQRYPLCVFLWHAWQSFQADGCLRTAAALTYMSLFAVVPLLTVLFAMLSAVPAFAQADSQIQQFIFSHFLPSSGQEIQTYLLQFSEQARKLTGIGIALLAVTALTMLMKIEQEFNTIWRAHRNRSGLSSFLRYWAILSLGPLCIGLAIGISTYLASLHLLFDQVDIFGVRKLLLVVAPYVLTTVAFTLLFVAIPNARVELKDAAIGGLASALCFEIAKYVFARVMANASYQFIYGTFAAIPLFLLWIYTSWVIVLAGAEIAHAIANYGNRSSKLPDLIAALGVLEILWRKYQRGELLTERELLRRDYLFGNCTLAAEQWTRLRNALLAAGLIKDGSSGEFVLTRNLQHFTLRELHECLSPAARLPQYSSTQPAWLQNLYRRLAELDDHQRAQMQVPLTTLFEEDHAHGENSHA